jgi:phage gp45-like
VALQNAVARGVVNRMDPDAAFAQIQTLGARQRPDTEVLQGQGVHFKAPDGSDCIALAPAGDSGSAVAIVAGDRTQLPALSVPPMLPGEGGLHYLGTWKVYLSADGTVSLGAAPLDATDFVALASKVDAAIVALKVAIVAGISALAAPAVPATAVSAFNASLVSVPTLPVGSVILKAV